MIFLGRNSPGVWSSLELQPLHIGVQHEAVLTFERSNRTQKVRVYVAFYMDALAWELTGKGIHLRHLGYLGLVDIV